MSKAKGIKRYFIQAEIGYREYPELFINENVDGDWVKYDDIAELEQQNKEMLNYMIKEFKNSFIADERQREYLFDDLVNIIEKITGKSIDEVIK